MEKAYRIEVKVEAPKGMSIQAACGEVKELSEFIGKDLTFEFNDVPITTKNKSIKEMIDSYMISRG